MRYYDLSQDKNYQEVVTKFGGEEYLEENYPLVYRVFQNSRKYSQCESFALRGVNDTATVGRQDILMSSLVEDVSTKGTETTESMLKQVTRFNFQEQKACVITNTVIVDESGKVYGTFSNLCENTYNENVINDIEGIIMDHPYKLKLKTVITNFTIDQETGEPVANICEAIQKNDSVYICSDGSVIESVKVQDPVNKFPNDKDATYIVYGDRQEQCVSYQYPNVPSPQTIGGVKYAKIWCPFKITVELSEKTFWEKGPLSNNDFTVCLESTNPNKYGGGGICYNNTFENIKTSLSADKKQLTIELSPDWNALLTVNDINLVIGSFKFYACFKVNYNMEIAGKILPQMATVIAATDVVLTKSSDYVARIQIRWGCFGKDCILITPQGEKRIRDLKAGDSVLTVDGDYAKITEITTGQEQDIVNIQLAGHDDILQLTESHGIETHRGLIPAGDLKFEDEILTADKTYKPLGFLEKQTYDDVVYNIETEAHAMLVVNGMIVAEKEAVPEISDRNKPVQKFPEELLAELRQLVEDKNIGRF